MKIILCVSLTMRDGSWDLLGVEKEVELDFLPNEGDGIADNGISFKVESRIFNISEKFVDIYLVGLEILDEEHKKDILKRMHDSGWYYRDQKVYNLLDEIKN